MTRDQVIERIKQLLDLESDQDGLPEGELAGKIAYRLMKEHSVAHADLILAGRTDGLCRVDEKIGARSRWRRRLLTFIGKHLDVRVHYTRGTTDVHLFGYEHDVTLAMYLYEVCESQIARAAQKYYQEKRDDGMLQQLLLEKMSFYDEDISEDDPEFLSKWKGVLRKLRNDFCMSAVSGLDAKLEAQRKADKEESTNNSTALVRAKWNLVVEFTDSFGKAGKAGRLSYNHNSAGYKTGQDINLPSGGLPPQSQETRPSRLLQEAKGC